MGGSRGQSDAAILNKRAESWQSGWRLARDLGEGREQPCRVRGGAKGSLAITEKGLCWSVLEAAGKPVRKQRGGEVRMNKGSGL